MKYLLLIIAIAFPISLFAQEEKGGKPISSATGGVRLGTTRAVVVGISDYQDKDIPDLRFADKDAEAFANFLRSPAGGSLDADRLRVLINQQATLGQFVANLGWLLEHSKEDDRVIIYFSGHGDVDTKLVGQPGFLLLWDTPSETYMAGAYGLLYFQIVINTLTEVNKAKVLVVADACHSGKLAGSAIGGAQITTANMAKQFSNEIKILSCQPNEYSIEGEEWGGGRGAFSFHLVDGLYGMADGNNDASVTLSEIDRYLEDHVVHEVAPMQQTPMVIGDRKTALSKVHFEFLKQWRQSRQLQSSQINIIEQRKLENETLSKTDTSIHRIYFAFKQALHDKIFLESPGGQTADSCANAYYLKLMAVTTLQPLHGAITRNFAAALMDESQQAVNAVLNIDVQALTRSVREQMEFYKRTPALLARSAELLGEQHYLFATLKARQWLFDGMWQYLNQASSEDPKDWIPVLEKFRRSLQYEANSPLAHFYLSVCFASRLKEPDSAYVHAMEATRFAETWLLPYTFLAYYYSRHYKRFEQAKALLDKAMSLDSSNVYVWKAWGAYHFYQKQNGQAIEAYKKATQLSPDNPIAWTDFGTACLQSRRFDEAENAFQRALQLDSTLFVACLSLGNYYATVKRSEEAEIMYRRAIQLHPSDVAPYRGLAILYLSQNRLAEAEAQYLQVVRYNSADANIWYKLTLFAALDNRPQQALERLEKCFELGMKNYQTIMTEPDLESVRNTPAFKKLMEKYFPEQPKD